MPHENSVETAPASAQTPPTVDAAEGIQTPAAYRPSRADKLFACATAVLAWFYVHYILFEAEGVCVTIFAFVSLGLVTAYLMHYGAKMTRKPAVLLVSLLITAVGFSLFTGVISASVRPLFLLYGSTYYITCLSGGLSYNARDLMRAVFIVPFYNFLNLPLSLLPRQEEKAKGPSAGASAIGIAMGLFFLLFVSSLLFGADEGGFAGVFGTFAKQIENIRITEWILSCLVAMYWFGLASGFAHRRGIGSRQAPSYAEVPATTALAALLAIIAGYAAILACNLGYYTSALYGALPAGTDS